MIGDATKAAIVLFAVVLIQVSAIWAQVVDLPLVALVSIALLRGSMFGAVAGFWTGLLIDTATLGTLGFSSLLLTLAGFWTGRYGETTGRDRGHAPFTSVGVVTMLTAVSALVLHYLLGDPAPARLVLVDTLPKEVALNLLLIAPVYGLSRRLFPPGELGDRVSVVRLLG
jgi:rod shape-determining protein MreD